jgi:uncharacterized membrane protein
MSRSLKVILAGLLVGLALWGFFLAKQGLDRADKWSSVVGMFASTLLGVAGLVMGWLGLRNAAGSSSAGPGQSVAGSTIGRDNIQIGTARDVNIDRRG